MKIVLDPLTLEYQESVIDIFNDYVENSFAAYPERPVPYEFFNRLLEMSRGYPAIVAKDEYGKVVGFGMLRAYSPMPTFAHSAEITYFIHPDYTGQGIGQQMLAHLEEKGLEQGVTIILASISSLNPGSLRFHARNGFVECGRFAGIGCKKGQRFDVVYMQKVLQTG